MLIASSMGATAFQKGLGAMHSLSHPCGANLNTHHGLTNAVVMPYVLAWNRDAIEDEARRASPRTWDSKDTSFDGVLEWVLELRRTIGIPNTLADIGVRVEHAAAFRAAGVCGSLDRRQPVAVDSAQFERLYLNCIRGELTAADGAT